MSDFFSPGWFPAAFVTFDVEGIGAYLKGAQQISIGGSAPTAWPAANRAIYVPAVVSGPILVLSMFVGNGVVAGGNGDCGIYDEVGRRIVSSGSVVRAGNNNVQQYNIADTPLPPGIYYLAYAQDVTDGMQAIAYLTLGYARASGVLQEAGAFPLPALATFAELTSNYTPVIGASLRSQVT